MDENEMAVNGEEQTAEDLLPEDIAEEPQDDSESLEEILNEEGEPQEEPQGTGGKREPGYVQGRINKAVEKAVAEVRAQMEADFEQRMAPYREQMLTAEAQELVRSGKVKDLETAKELVRYRQGQPQPERQEQNRNERGQFAANQQDEPDPATKARIDILEKQAKRIKEQRGIDVIDEFKKNPEVKKKLVSGEWDFYEVADYMTSRKKTPAPMRSPNGASGLQKTAIDNMSDEQFARLEKRIKEGARYTLK